MAVTIPINASTRGVTTVKAKRAASPLKLAIGVKRTGDRKLSACPEIIPCKNLSSCKHKVFVSVTHAAKRSCPITCAFYVSPEEIAAGKKDPCYTGQGKEAIVVRRLEEAARAFDADALAVALAEALQIDGLSGRYLLRLHVVGDCREDALARIVSDAAVRYSARHGQLVWTYTHAWRTVARESWQTVSVLASCETDDDAALATSRGYAVALVRAHKDLPRTVAGLRTIPCPQQAGAKLDCATCRMCTRDTSLVGRACIVFDPHGSVDAVNAAIFNRT